MRHGAGARERGIAILVCCLIVLITCVPGRAQGTARVEPDSLAERFQRALRARDWRAVARQMHPDALARFRGLIDRLVEAGGATTLEALLPGIEPEEYAGLSSDRVFVRTLRTLRERAPGLLHALVVREVEIIGTVPEPPDRAYTVYRSTALISGAVPEIRVMTLERHEEGWAVRESQELEVIRESLRGTPRRARPP